MIDTLIMKTAMTKLHYPKMAGKLDAFKYNFGTTNSKTKFSLAHLLIATGYIYSFRYTLTSALDNRYI